MANEPVIVVLERNLDGAKFVREQADTDAQLLAAYINRTAKQFVRKDTWELWNSIQTARESFANYQVSAGGGATAHAASQEYGRPDLANYGFTPYMRPAALLSQTSPQTRLAVFRAVRDAQKKAKVNVRKKVV